MAAYRRVYDIICRLTAKNRDQLRNPTLGIRVWATFLHAHASHQPTTNLQPYPNFNYSSHAYILPIRQILFLNYSHRHTD